MHHQGEPFAGVIRRTVDKSIPAWPQPTRARDGAPNVVIVLLDDVGFAQFSCFGGAISTPTIDQLASNGLRYRNFHATALCSPSRACILTGRNHHAVGAGIVATVETGFPGYNLQLNKQKAFLSEMLRAAGYATFAIGKWHLTPADELAPGSTRARWPLSRGFDRFYGFWTKCDHWRPDLIHDNHFVEPPRTPAEGYHLNEDLASRAIEFISDLRAVAPDQPFFMYYCPGAGHSPHHVPREWADQYRGAFDDGWEAVRDDIFARQIAMGIVPGSTQLLAQPSWIQKWESIGSEERRLYRRQMEVYAGFISQTDHHIGRLVAFLDELGELENTVFLLTSDNGASGEGGPYGHAKASTVRLGREGIIATSLELLDDWGGPTTYPHYAWGWAWAGNTPLRRWKGYVHEGGIACPFIVHWPTQIASGGEIRSQYIHAIDIAPTVLDALGLEPPKEVEGVPQKPLHGRSFRSTFGGPTAAAPRDMQYYEMRGSRALWEGGWKAVAEQEPGVLLTDDVLNQQVWELYHVEEDFSEASDLAERHPERLRELVDLWWAEAGRYDVLPLDARGQSRLTTRLSYGREDRGEPPRTRFVYYPGAAPVPSWYAADVNGRTHRIIATVELPPAAEGVLLAQGGGHFGGYSLYVKDARLHYVHNWLGLERYTITSWSVLPEGSASLLFRYEEIADGVGTGVLSVNGEEVARGEIGRVTPSASVAFSESLTCGYASGSVRPPTDDYEPPFRFNGKIRSVVVEVDSTAPANRQTMTDTTQLWDTNPSGGDR